MNNRIGTSILIEDDMITRMGLTGNRLVIYALINGYCKRYGYCAATIYDIAERVGLSARRASDNVLALVADGYLERQTGSKTIAIYRLSDKWSAGGQNVMTITGRNVRLQSDVSSYCSMTKRPAKDSCSVQITTTLQNDSIDYLRDETSEDETSDVLSAPPSPLSPVSPSFPSSPTPPITYTPPIPPISPSPRDDDAHDARRAREEEQAGGRLQPVEELAEELRGEIERGGTVAESAMRLYGIGPQELAEYVGWFADKLAVDGTGFKTRTDFRRHFGSWLRIQAEQKQAKQNNNNGKHNGPTDEFIARLAAEAAASGGLAF